MPRTTRIEIILFAALCFFLPSIPSTTVQGGDLASRKACVNKFLPLLRQRVLYIQYQRLIRISGGSDDMSEFEQLRSAEDKMDDVESVEESMPPRESIPSEQETTPSEDEQEEQKPLEEEDMELDHDSLSEHEQEDSEVVLKRKLDELVTMTDKDIFDKFYDRSKSQQAKRPNEKQRSMAEAKFRADDFDNHVQVVDNKIVIGQRRKAVNQREEKQRRELRLFDMLVQNATWAEAATRAYRFHHYEDFDITKPVSFNADQEFIKNWAGAVRGAVALRKGICLPSFPVPKQPINDVRYPGGSCMPDPECPPITHQVELFPISRIPMDELVGRVGGSVPSSRRKTCLPFPLDHPANSSIRERYYKPVRATRDMTRGKKKEMMQGATYTREFIEAQYRKAEQRRSRDEDFEQHLKVMFPYQDILPDGLLNTSSSRTEQYFKLPHHWYLGSENRRFGLPKDRGGGMEMEGAGEGGQEMLGDPKRGFGSRWERMDLFDLETPPPQTFDLDEDRVVLEDGSIVNKRTRLRQLLNGTVVPLDSSEDDEETPDWMLPVVLLTEEQMSDRFVSIMQAHKDKLYSLLRPQDYGNATQGQEVVQDETSPVPKDNAEGEEEEEDAAFVRIPAGKHVEDEQTIKLMKMMSRGAKEGKELRISAGLHRWLDKLRFQPGTTRWMNPTNGQTETMANQRWLRIRGDERGDVAVTGKLGGACLWGQWKVYHGTRGWLERVSLILDTDCCYRPTFQVQGGNWSVTDCEVRAILTITMVVRDFAAVKMKDCVIGGCDFGWFVATDGVVVKDRARVRMKGGRGEYVAALGCVASSDGMSEVTVEKMLVHRCYFGVKVNGEGIVKLRDSIFRDIKIAALLSGSVTREKQEMVLVNNSFFCEMWFGDCRPANLEGFSSCWNASRAGPLPIPWIAFAFPEELEKDRLTSFIPPTKEEEEEYDKIEKARYEKMYKILEQHGGNVSNIADHDVRYKVKQRMQELENIKRYEEAEKRGEDLVAEYRKTCWCEKCATPHLLVPPQHNNGSAFIDEQSGCWAFPVYNDGKNWTEQIENERKRVIENSIVNLADIDSINVTEFAMVLSELEGRDLRDMLKEFEEYKQSYLDARPNRTIAQATRRLKREVLKMFLMVYQSNYMADNPKRYTGLDGEVSNVYQKGGHLFNIDYGESSDEEYDGIKYHLKPGGLGWYVYNRTKFEEEASAKLEKQNGIGTLDDIFPQMDGSYALPDPWAKGRKMKQIPITPFHMLEGIRMPDEFYLTDPNTSWKQTPSLVDAEVEDTWDYMGNPLPIQEEMKKNSSNIVSRPGRFRLSPFGPFANDLDGIGFEDEEGNPLQDSEGNEIAVPHQDYLKAVWDKTIRKKKRVFDVPVSANHPPPLVRMGKRIKVDSTSWARTIMHPGCEWSGQAPSMDPATWPNPYDPS